MGGMGEMCRGARKSLYKGSVADANSLKQLRQLNKTRDKNKGGRFWLGGATAISDFSFCLVARALVLRSFPFLWCPLLRIFFFSCHWSWQLFPLVEDFLMSQLDEASWVLGWMEKREKHRRERLYLKACVCGLQSVSSNTLGCHHTAQPSPAQSI